jgi:DNA-binding YbaB/EbfC family protein
MPDMQALLQQAQQMQQQLMSAQQELADAEVSGTAGGGLVTAVVTGAGELKSLDIDPKVVDPDDVETLADLIVAAVHNASDKAQELAASKMGPLAGGLGGDLGGLGNLGLPGF